MKRAIRKISFRLTAAELADFEQLLKLPYTHTWTRLVRRALTCYFNSIRQNDVSLSDRDRGPTIPSAEELQTAELVFKKPVRKQRVKRVKLRKSCDFSVKIEKGGEA